MNDESNEVVKGKMEQIAVCLAGKAARFNGARWQVDFIIQQSFLTVLPDKLLWEQWGAFSERLVELAGLLSIIIVAAAFCSVASFNSLAIHLHNWFKVTPSTFLSFLLSTGDSSFLHGLTIFQWLKVCRCKHSSIHSKLWISCTECFKLQERFNLLYIVEGWLTGDF